VLAPYVFVYVFSFEVFQLLQGLIQSVFELHDGSGVVVTVGKYITPKHMDINGNGIRPDFDQLPGT
jgi:Peptidase family S41